MGKLWDLLAPGGAGCLGSGRVGGQLGSGRGAKCRGAGPVYPQVRRLLSRQVRFQITTAIAHQSRSCASRFSRVRPRQQRPLEIWPAFTAPSPIIAPVAGGRATFIRFDRRQNQPRRHSHPADPVQRPRWLRSRDACQAGAQTMTVHSQGQAIAKPYRPKAAKPTFHQKRTTFDGLYCKSLLRKFK